tara:strand:- start:744 stop:1232 length:489 start_codon:yes stop_codon:yes gene_type:complete
MNCSALPEAFLIELSKDTSLPDKKRQEARRLLRHYPSRKEVLLAGEIEEILMSGTIFTPMLSSKEEYVKTTPIPPSQIEHTISQKIARDDEKMISDDDSKQEITVAIWRAAIELFGGDRTAADKWLHSEALALGWKRPIDVIQEDAQQVMDLITRIDRGVYT